MGISDERGHQREDPRTGLVFAPALTRLEELISEHKTELLVVDGVSDTFAGNENARGEVKRFVNPLVGLIQPDRGAVLLGHIAKPAASNSATSEG